MFSDWRRTSDGLVPKRELCLKLFTATPFRYSLSCLKFFSYFVVKGNCCIHCSHLCWHLSGSEAESNSGKPEPLSPHLLNWSFKTISANLQSYPTNDHSFTERGILSISRQWKSSKSLWGIKDRKETEAHDWVPSLIHKHLTLALHTLSYCHCQTLLWWHFHHSKCSKNSLQSPLHEMNAK